MHYERGFVGFKQGYVEYKRGFMGYEQGRVRILTLQKIPKKKAAMPS